MTDPIYKCAHAKQGPTDLGDRTVRFVASTPSEDRDGDTIAPRGIKTQSFQRNPVALFAHQKAAPPIGRVVNTTVKGDEFLADIRFDKDDRSELIYQKVQSGSLNAVSIGFMPVEGEVERREEGGFHFKQVELLEISVVPVPSNDDAVVVGRELSDRYSKMLGQWARGVQKDAPDLLERAPEDFPAPPDAVRDNLRTGLEWHEEGFSGDGLQQSTVRWARRMAEGEAPSRDKALKMGSWFPRHLNQDGPLREDGDPTPKAVAIKLWGGKEAGPAYARRLYRAMDREIPDGLEGLSGDVPVTKAGRTLSKANIERVKRIVRAALEMAADEGIDVDTIVTEAMEEVETDGMDEDDKSVDPDVKMPGAGVRREVRGLLQAKDNALGAMKDLVKSDQPVSEGAVSRQMRQLVRQDMRRNRTIMEAMGAGGDDDGGEMEGRDAPDSGIVEKAATDFQDLPLAARDREWDGAAAVGRWREFTGSEDEPSDDYWQNFMWWDAKSGENFGAYKLPYGDIIDGDHVAVPRAIFAIAAALEGARGGVDIPGEDADAVRGHVTQYYAKMRDAFDDDSIIAPWNAEESFDDWQDMQREALGIEGKGVVELAWQDDNGGGENDEDQIIELAFSQDADGGGAGDDDDSSVFEIAE